jgi:hypothetical protein
MRFHTDTLTPMHLHEIVKSTGLAAEGVAIAHADMHNSRSHKAGIEIVLRASPGKDRFGKTRRNPNSGTSGAYNDYEKAATYDEWGIFMAKLFELEPTASFGRTYKDADDFHASTKGAYA